MGGDLMGTKTCPKCYTGAVGHLCDAHSAIRKDIKAIEHRVCRSYQERFKVWFRDKLFSTMMDPEARTFLESFIETLPVEYEDDGSDLLGAAMIEVAHLHAEATIRPDVLPARVVCLNEVLELLDRIHKGKI